MTVDIDAVMAQAWELIDAGDTDKANRLLIHSSHRGIEPKDLLIAGVRVRRTGPVTPLIGDSMKMHHPDLGATIDVPESTVEIYKRAGWVEGEGPSTSDPRRAPLPATPEPDPEPVKKTSKTSD